MNIKNDHALSVLFDKAQTNRTTLSASSGGFKLALPLYSYPVFSNLCARFVMRINHDKSGRKSNKTLI